MAATNQQLLAAAQVASATINFQISPIIIKLDRNNYSLWRTTVISALECFDLDSFIINPSPPDETIPGAVNHSVLAVAEAPPVAAARVPNPEFLAWKKKDRFVLLWIKSTLTDQSLATVARFTSSQQAWITLERHFQAQT
ncbi:hypothetical protein LXL04_031911 [Taraxacum kok-saghyz]